jgi:hypothetical protein
MTHLIQRAPESEHASRTRKASDRRLFSMQITGEVFSTCDRETWKLFRMNLTEEKKRVSGANAFAI